MTEPATVLLYRDDPYLLEFDARVVRHVDYDGRPAVVLDRTAFYAESGGQPWDTGRLGPSRVLAVVEHDGQVLHVVDTLPPEGMLHGAVDGARRRDHLQQHHGQHLLSRALVDTAGAATVSFHLGAEESSIDLDRPVTDAQARDAERRADEVVWEGRPVSVRTVERTEALGLGVRVPDEAGTVVRLVEAEGFDRQACSGTHPRRTSEVGLILVLGHERYKGGTRIRFVCGQRALAAIHARLTALETTAQALSTAWSATAEAASRALEQGATLFRQNQELREGARASEAQALLAAQGTTTPAVVWAVYDDRDAADLRGLAEHLVRDRPSVALLASRGAKVQLVFARSAGLATDMAALLKATLGPVGGRGGGRPELAQGGCERLPELESVLERLATEVTAATRATA